MVSKKRDQLRINFLGCLMETSTATLPMIPIASFLLLVAVGIFLQVKLFLAVFAIATQELGISAGLGVALCA